MTPWLFRLPLRHLRQYPGRTFLGILGIALGTAVYLSISLAAASAIESFQAGVAAVAGKAQWRVQSPGAPLNENLFARLSLLPGVKAAAPVVRSVLQLRGPHRGPVLLLGIDPFSEKDFRDYEFAQEGGLPGGLSRRDWVEFPHQPRCGSGWPTAGVPTGPQGGRPFAGVGGCGQKESHRQGHISLRKRPLPPGRGGAPHGRGRGPGAFGPGGAAGLYRPLDHRD